MPTRAISNSGSTAPPARCDDDVRVRFVQHAQRILHVVGRGEVSLTGAANARAGHSRDTGSVEYRVDGPLATRARQMITTLALPASGASTARRILTPTAAQSLHAC